MFRQGHRRKPRFASASLALLVCGLFACSSTQEASVLPAQGAVPPVLKPPPDAAAELLMAPKVAPSPVFAKASFADCITALQARALAVGVSAATVEGVLGQVQPLPRVIELDRKQPEFSETFRHYLTQRVTAQRIDQGRSMLAKHRALLQQIESEHGVPAQYVLAFWGLETNYGSYLGSLSVLDSLATLACDQRRSEFFTAELFDALRLVDAGVVTPAAFQGSWAGAVGNVQFMPSTYRRYAVDADGNGKADLWRSIPDALTSAAHYLRQIGWQPSERWGREVVLPAGFDYAQATLQQRKPLREWAAMSVRLPSGDALPALDMMAAILVPAGHAGPAFVVYDNFDVILKWNRSEYYGIAVGHLADRILGGGDLYRTPPVQPRMRVEQVKQLQQRLTAAGFDAGSADGIMGSGTRKALRQWQVAQGMVADGYPSTSVLERLGVP